MAGDYIASLLGRSTSFLLFPDQDLIMWLLRRGMAILIYTLRDNEGCFNGWLMVVVMRGNRYLNMYDVVCGYRAVLEWGGWRIVSMS